MILYYVYLYMCVYMHMCMPFEIIGTHIHILWKDWHSQSNTIIISNNNFNPCEAFKIFSLWKLNKIWLTKNIMLCGRFPKFMINLVPFPIVILVQIFFLHCTLWSPFLSSESPSKWETFFYAMLKSKSFCSYLLHLTAFLNCLLCAQGMSWYLLIPKSAYNYCCCFCQ